MAEEDASSSGSGTILPPPPVSLTSPDTVCRVSSVLNGDRVQFGAPNMFDGAVETCWNSDQGSPQRVLLDFGQDVRLASLTIAFQGGFAGRECSLLGCISGQAPEPFFDFFPDDINTPQTFNIPEESTKVVINRLVLVMSSSTDFFGRITVYSLDVKGWVQEPA
eukprot:UC1_evm2s1304